MIFLLTFLLVILLIVLLVKLVIYPTFYTETIIHDYDDGEEVVTTTTTTTTTVEEPAQPEYTIVGNLVRVKDETTGQWFTTDPVDGKKYFLNEIDDLFQDANGAVWRVIDKPVIPTA